MHILQSKLIFYWLKFQGKVYSHNKETYNKKEQVKSQIIESVGKKWLHFGKQYTWNDTHRSKPLHIEFSFSLIVCGVFYQIYT